MGRKFIITEEQEKILINKLNEEVYQMPVDKKMNKPYCINPEKVLIVKKFLDKTFKHHDLEKIGSSGMPIRIKVFSMNASNGEPLKYMYKDQLHDLLIDRFQNMFMDKIERSLFMKQVIDDWVNGSIGVFGTLSRNSLMENTMAEIDEKAKEANTNPTDGQKEAGNYKMGHIRINGLPISIETPKGTIRTYKNDDGTEGKIKMRCHYGYFTNTTAQGKDGDAVDVFIGPNVDSFEYVYVIDQNNNDGDFDESKVMLGFNSIEHAKQIFMDCHTSDWKGFRNITKVSFNVFKKWLYRKHKQQKPFYDYYYIRKNKINEGKELDILSEVKVAKLPSQNLCEELKYELERYNISSRIDEKYIFVESNNVFNINESKRIIENYLDENTDINPYYVLSEECINEENYNQICKVVEVDDIETAEDIADEINKHGVYAFTKSNIVYVEIEQDFSDIDYVNDTLRKCKELAYSYVMENKQFENLHLLENSIKNDDVRKIGNITAILENKTKCWEIHDTKNGKKLGTFNGNIGCITLDEIYNNMY
jgi:hypothetical protein